MKSTEEVTAAGRGDWGGAPTDFVLSTVTRVWQARRSEESRSTLEFRLTFQRGGSAWDWRGFGNAHERQTFVDASMPGWRPLSPTPAVPLRGGVLPLQSLDGDELVGVWFVRDYLTLQFDHETLHLHVWPTVRFSEGQLAFGQPHYRDRLCSLIDRQVVLADIFLDDGIVIDFETAELRLSPKQIRDCPSPEVLELSGCGPLGAQDLPFDLE